MLAGRFAVYSCVDECTYGAHVNASIICNSYLCTIECPQRPDTPRRARLGVWAECGGRVYKSNSLIRKCPIP